MGRTRWSSDSRAPPLTSRCAASRPTTALSALSGTTTKAIMRPSLAPNALVVPEDPRVDLRAHRRVDHVDGDGDVVDVVLADLVDHLRQRQAGCSL